ncbi:hypothetical protein L226DRAFT_573231 [Lentinus tigrinus ALCF2SS1-7]|uniref:DUF6533 domain-containing protein n=1 Tax=Lentinus tigrinus ALCF2SS1-6 TaxID=1328759 RepID=A0A5C2S3G3_9APHY|nr:hypothetical protein L227DRAFT_613213 [Lentinus tigrinus ALCF2SS1-6]RPD72157.1 hypothetical protein L226DRAFT_573231 [Lentinus tigrinus ALCF2SS1-7]
MSSYTILTVISVYEIAYIGNYCSVAALALAAYAWMDSLGDEVTLVWSIKKKRTYAMLVYALTRYATLAEYAVAIVPLGKLPLLVRGILLFRPYLPMSLITGQSCEVVVWLQVVFVAASSLGAAAFSALRIYALSRSNRTLAALIFFLLLAPCVVDTVFNSKWIDVEELPSPFYCVRQSTASMYSFYVYCNSTGSPDVVIMFSVTTASRICAILADLIVAAATWMHAYKARHAHKLSSGPTLGQVMLYDGSMYFIVLASLNIIRIVFSSLAVDNVSSAASSIPIFTDL